MSPCIEKCLVKALYKLHSALYSTVSSPAIPSFTLLSETYNLCLDSLRNHSFFLCDE